MSKEVIQDQDGLLRRVPKSDLRYIKPDNTISSFAFKKKKDEDGLSVDIERKTSYEVAILNNHQFSLCKITAGLVRSIELDAVHDPLPDNEAHALITGHITNGKAKRMAQRAQFVMG